MSVFRFNFSGDELIQQKQNDTKETVHWMESEEVIPDRQITNLDDLAAHAKMFTCGEIEIGHVIASDSMLKSDSCGLKTKIKLNETQHSDLVIGKYEGGLKIWECTFDLIKYLVTNKDTIQFKGANVLDVGCGAGMLGIYAFMNGSRVTFQDYNKEVLEHVTIPNVLLNIEEEDRETEIKKCKFYSGDWASFNKKLIESEVYDIILTSETIYNPCNYEKLIELFTQRLRKNGIVYVAAKTCYFGVGGSTRQFEKSVKDSKLLKSDVCWESSGGIQREILIITRT